MIARALAFSNRDNRVGISLYIGDNSAIACGRTIIHTCLILASTSNVGA